MDRTQNRLDQYSTAPTPFKLHMQEQGRRQLETLSSMRQPRSETVRVAPLVDQPMMRLSQERPQDRVSGGSAQLSGMDQPLERQRQFLSTRGKITQQFGNRNPIERFSGGINYGTDIAVPRGTKVALPDGQWEVMEAFDGAEGDGYIGNNTNRGYGNSVLVRNRDTGEMMRFSHLSDAMVRAGQVLNGGTVVGLSGSTGNSTGPHLDLEYYDSRGRISDVLRSRYASMIDGREQPGGMGGGNPLEKLKETGAKIASHLDPSNLDTPVLGPIRQAMGSTPLGKPAYADASLNPSQRMTDAITRYGESFAGHSTPASRAFSSNLRNSPTTQAIPMDEIKEISGPLERYLMNIDDPVYHVFGRKAKDEAFIKDVAGHYIGKDILKRFKDNPKEVARELLNRVLLDRTEIPR